MKKEIKKNEFMGQLVTSLDKTNPCFLKTVSFWRSSQRGYLTTNKRAIWRQCLPVYDIGLVNKIGFS